ncbi:MAG TPA: hypothetical protein VMH26_17175 [Burkholderiales bacterium]|nr:hypothetical protein [Burkholderiales bacterium]
MTSFRTVWAMLACIAVLAPGDATAQLDQAISDKDLTDPWIRAKAVVLSLAPLLGALAEPDNLQVDSVLGQLDDQLAKLQEQEESAAIRIASNPAFAYDASLSAADMADQVSQIDQSFDSLFRDLMVRQRADVQAMQASLASLRRLLSDKNSLERDVVRAIAAGGKNEIQALAGRWWAASESVGSVREAISTVRRQLAAQPRHG